MSFLLIAGSDQWIEKLVKHQVFSYDNRTLIRALFAEPGFFYNLEKPLFL